MMNRIRELYYINRFLLHHSQSGFEQLYAHYTPSLFRLAIQLTAGDKPMAEAIVARTWVRAIEELLFFSSIQKLSERLRFLLVTSSTAHYQCLDQYILLHDPLCEKIALRLKYADHAIDSNGEIFFRSVPIGFRHVFVLHDINGYPHKTISALLRISEKASRRLLFKARKVFALAGKDSEPKVLRSVFSHISLSKELEQNIADRLFAKGLIASTPYKINALNDFLNAFADTRKWAMH